MTPVGRDLMPYAPVHIEACGSWGADITLTWQRRTRVGGELVDGGGDVPLAEDSEAYEVDILATVDGPVLRTLEVTERQAVYTAAQQAEDWDAYYPLALVNPGAETGDTTGWTNELGAALVADDDYENLSRPGPAATSSGRPATPRVDHRDTQAVDVSGWAHAIDQGSAMARGRVYVNETDSGSDDGRVSLIFLDEGDNVLGSEEPAYAALTPRHLGAARGRGGDPGRHPHDQDLPGQPPRQPAGFRRLRRCHPRDQSRQRAHRAVRRRSTRSAPRSAAGFPAMPRWTCHEQQSEPQPGRSGAEPERGHDQRPGAVSSTPRSPSRSTPTSRPATSR